MEIVGETLFGKTEIKSLKEMVQDRIVEIENEAIRCRNKFDNADDSIVACIWSARLQAMLEENHKLTIMLQACKE